MNIVVAVLMKMRKHKAIMRFVPPILLFCGLAGLVMGFSAQNLLAQEAASTWASTSSDPLLDFSCPDGPDCIANRYPDWADTLHVPPGGLRQPIDQGGLALPTPTPFANVGSYAQPDAQIGQIDDSGLNAASIDSNNSRGGEDGGSAPIEYRSPANFSQGFDNVTLLPGQEWFFRNNSSPAGSTNWFQGNNEVFTAHAGATNAYIAANYNNTAGTGTISNWMVTPVLTMANGNTFSFWTRTPADILWPDRLELRLSTAGASTNVGSTATSVGDFSTLLLSVNPSLAQGGYPETWTRYSVTLAGMPGGATGRFALRYYVTNGGPTGANSSYIGIDTVEYTGSLANFSCSNVTQIPQNECQALVALYNSTSGPGWTDSNGWLVTNTPCNWYGVLCDADHVVVIYLTENQLTGTLPAVLGNLSRLRYLNVFQNRLTGQIPSQLGNLSNLQELNLGQNQFSGSIPPQIGNLSNLSYFSIYVNQIGGSIPPELGNLTNLRSLDFYANRLTGSIPPQLANMSSLDFFRLNNNLISGTIPPELSQLTSVRLIDFNTNFLSGSIPTQLGSLTNLRSLGLAGNQLSGSIPVQLSNLNNLQALSLNSNRLAGSIPSQLGGLSGLEHLALERNQLTGSIPVQLCNLNSLAENNLDLGFNMLSSGPACIANKDPDWANTQTVPPTGLQATAQSPNQVGLTWTPILYTGDGGYYEISYAISSGGPYTVHGTTADKSASSYVVTGLAPGTTFYFRVRTHTPAHGDQQNNLWSDYSATVSSTTGFATRSQYLPLVLNRFAPIPGAPVLNAITPPGANPSYSITWNPATSATSYLLQRATNASFTDAAQMYEGASTGYSVPSQGIARYFYRVQARNQWGSSSWSNVQSVDMRWEREPNNTYDIANGPLNSGLDHYGFPNDASDYFFFQTTRRGQITIDLNNHNGQGIQLLLYYPAGTLVGQDITEPYRLEYTGDPGRYYVRVYSTGGFNSATPYSLRVVLP